MLIICSNWLFFHCRIGVLQKMQKLIHDDSSMTIKVMPNETDIILNRTSTVIQPYSNSSESLLLDSETKSFSILKGETSIVELRKGSK